MHASPSAVHGRRRSDRRRAVDCAAGTARLWTVAGPPPCSACNAVSTSLGTCCSTGPVTWTPRYKRKSALLACELRPPLLGERTHPLGGGGGTEQHGLAGALALEGG